jgi:hypothetical protein
LSQLKEQFSPSKPPLAEELVEKLWEFINAETWSYYLEQHPELLRDEVVIILKTVIRSALDNSMGESTSYPQTRAE